MTQPADGARGPRNTDDGKMDDRVKGNVVLIVHKVAFLEEVIAMKTVGVRIYTPDYQVVKWSENDTEYIDYDVITIYGALIPNGH